MKMTFLLSAAAAFLLTGCGNNSTPSTSPTNSVSAATNAGSPPPVPAPAPGDYLGALGQAEQSSVKRVNTAYLTQAIQQFNAAEGRYPKDLQELVPTYIAKIPDAPEGYKLDYDPATGNVTVVKQ
ncbi:MAG: hypothetical protein ACLQSR_04675 [Limisphaerales bacterium]